MKFSSNTSCGCCFYCYCHCWLMMLLMVSSIVHVSPETSATTPNRKFTKLFNNKYTLHSEMTELISLNRKIPNSKTTRTVATSSKLPKISPPPPPLVQPQFTNSTRTTTDTQFKQNTTVNSYLTTEKEPVTTDVTQQAKSTISSTVHATEISPPLTSMPAYKQLQMTQLLNSYNTTVASTSVTKRKSRQKKGIFYKVNESVVEAASTSRSTATNNYVADKSSVTVPIKILRIDQTTKAFVQPVTMEMIKEARNVNGSSNYSDKNAKYLNVAIDLTTNSGQKHNNAETIRSNNSKLVKSKSNKDFTKIKSSKRSIRSKQKTTNTFSLNCNNRYKTINKSACIKTTTTTTTTTNTATKSLQEKQQEYLEIKMENNTSKTMPTTATALDATQIVTAINSLPSNGTTDFSKSSRHNSENHNSINSNYIGARTDSVRKLSPKQIKQSPKDSYHQQKRTSISQTTISTITSLQLRTPATYLNSYPQHHHNNRWKRSALLHRHGRQAAVEEEQSEKCRMFLEGEAEKNELYSPEYPNDYPKNINCTRVITAPKGQIIRLDFRNSFNIEEKEECKFDFLEIRDGQYGFSTLIGKYCGSDFPPEITSKERYLWMHFHSDESIEYSGFTAVYEFIDRNRDAPSTDLNCTIEKDGFEGFVNATDVPAEIKDTVIRNKIPLDCIWRIQVQEKWKIQIKFVDFKLAKPNDCETNFLDIFPEQTVMPLRVKNFCGSAGEGITSDSNILHMRFYAEQIAINSTFSILYTAFRERGSSSCAEDEYDCEDATCIAADLKCNGRSNCKFLWDEEGCEEEDDGQSEHMIIIITVFGLILGGMVVTFLVNCIRKIMHDQKIIREHIRQSKESKLDEMGRNSKARSRENISIVSPRQKHSQTSLQILDDVSNRYYREMELQSKSNFKEKDPSILRHHDMIVQTSLCSTDDSSTTTTTDQQQRHQTPPAGVVVSNACDMGCQTRESLFATTSLLRQKSKTASLSGSQRTIEGVPPPPRFSTFGYDAAQIAPPPPPTVSTLSRRNMHLPQESLEMEHIPQQTTHAMMMMPRHQYQHQQQQQHHHQQQPQQQQQHLQRRPSQEICHHHHQHQQHLQQQQHKQTLPRYHTHHQQQQQLQQQHIQHPQHMQQHHHHTSSATIPASNVSQSPAPGTAIVTAISTGSSGRQRDPITTNAAVKSKQNKVDESKVFIDIRNSAPDVIIMTSH